MEKYNYFEAVKRDVKAYMEDNYSFNIEEWDSLEELEQHLNEVLWVCDSVTGNASGSYTFNRWEAEENLCHNLELLGEALREFCCEVNYLEEGAEYCDVTIRCYLLPQAISEVLEEIEDDFQAMLEEREENEDE